MGSDGQPRSSPFFVVVVALAERLCLPPAKGPTVVWGQKSGCEHLVIGLVMTCTRIVVNSRARLPLDRAAGARCTVLPRRRHRCRPAARAYLDPASRGPSILGQMQREPLVARALWPALLLTVLAFVVIDFVQHPFLGGSSDAAVVPRAHLTLWLAQTEGSGEADTVVHDVADSLLLSGRPATVATPAGGAARAIIGFFRSPHAADDLLAVSSETLADLAQERMSTLVGEEPLAAARAQRLLAEAVPLGVLRGAPLTLAVLPDSPIRDVAELLGQLRRSPDAHVFAIADDNWDTDNLATLVQDAGVEGVVPYRVFSSAQDASLALTAGSADVVLEPRTALLPDIRAARLRELPWPAAAGPPPRLWVELLTTPRASVTQVASLRRQLRAMTHGPVWREVLHSDEQAAVDPLASPRLDSFLPMQMARTAQLQAVVTNVEHR
jgi:hypothetical protein